MTNRKLAAWRPAANAAAATLHPNYCGASVALAREQRQRALHCTSSLHKGRLLLLNCIPLLRSKFSFSAAAVQLCVAVTRVWTYFFLVITRLLSVLRALSASTSWCASKQSKLSSSICLVYNFTPFYLSSGLVSAYITRVSLATMTNLLRMNSF